MREEERKRKLAQALLVTAINTKTRGDREAGGEEFNAG